MDNDVPPPPPDGAMSLLVTVQVLFAPAASVMLPSAAQSSPKLCV